MWCFEKAIFLSFENQELVKNKDSINQNIENSISYVTIWISKKVTQVSRKFLDYFLAYL